jgi:hypothetical protein
MVARVPRGDVIHVRQELGMNSVFMEYPLVSVFIAVIAMIVLINIFSPKRPQSGQRGGGFPIGLAPRTCRGCGAEHPPHAVYCRKCGGRL